MRKTYLGTLYYGVSDNFQRGLYRIARCLKAENHDLAVVEMIKLGVDTVNEENTIVKQASNQAINSEVICNTLTSVQKDNLVLETNFIAYDEQNKCLRTETIGTLTTDGSSPKHNNRVIESKKIKIRQATKDGFVDCEIGGGGGFGISIIGNTQGKSYRERKDMSDTNNGEYP